MMKPKDREFIKTVDDQLFCVVGYLHPPDGYTAYLKYIHSPTGKWSNGTTRYTRTLPFYSVSQVENTYRYLKIEYPKYLYECPVRNITISWVPKNRVQTYYKPRKRLEEITQRGAQDILEEKLLKLTELVESEISIKNSLGVTGSILTDTHNPRFSDIDLTVHGTKASNNIRKALTKLEQESNELRPISKQEIKNWIMNRVQRFPLSEDDLTKIADKRWNYGYIDDTYFSVHPIRNDDEITEEYGDNTYHKITKVSGKATILDTSESIFLPAIYKITDVESPQTSVDVSEIVSYEGLYGSLFKKDEKIRFQGYLEQIKGKNPHHRVIIGGADSNNSYIKWG